MLLPVLAAWPSMGFASLLFFVSLALHLENRLPRGVMPGAAALWALVISAHVYQFLTEL